MHTVTAFVNVNLVPMDHDGVVREQTVLVRGATISAIGPTSALDIPVGGFKALLEARQSLAHIGEFIPLCFLPPNPKDMDRLFLLSAGSLLILMISCASSVVGAMLRRARKIGTAEPFIPPLRMRKTAFVFTATAAFSIALFIFLILSGNLPLLIVATFMFAVMLPLTIRIAIASVRGWGGGSVGTRVQFASVALAAITFVSTTAFWFRFFGGAATPTWPK